MSTQLLGWKCNWKHWVICFYLIQHPWGVQHSYGPIRIWPSIWVTFGQFLTQLLLKCTLSRHHREQGVKMCSLSEQTPVCNTSELVFTESLSRITITHTHTDLQTAIKSQTHKLSLPLSLSHTHTATFSHTHTLPHKYTPTLSHKHTHTHT